MSGEMCSLASPSASGSFSDGNADSMASAIVQRHGNGFLPVRFSPMPSPYRILHHIFQLADVAAINILIEDPQQTRFEDKRGRKFFASVQKNSKISALFSSRLRCWRSGRLT
ncbi:hypothetical protein KCP74_01690 [Salmonella enterica subsp. enterica]|nr:hypothetical protein KCP74_01690 [Salmonella enterica subsp. enterica]